MSASPVELGPFTEGVNLVDPPVKLTPHELSQCLNWRTGVRGDFYKRPGHGNYGSSPAKINGDNFVNLDVRYYKSDGSKLRVAAAGGVLKFGNDTTGAWTIISINGTGAAMSATNLADWMVYKDRLYITDGVAAQRYNGTDDRFAGHPTAGAPTLAQTTGGSLTPSSTYKYFVTFVAGNMGEGPKGSEASIALSALNNRVNLTAIPTGAAGNEVSARRIYRTQANGSIFYFLAEILDNTTTTYNDIIADATLALNDEFVATQTPPATARYVIMGHDERAYWFGMPGADASLVYVSDIGFPDRIVSATGFFTVANNDGDRLTGGALVPGGIVFFKKNSMWLLRAFGFGLINIRPREKKGSGVGTLSHFSAVSTPVGLIFLSQQQKVYLFDGSNLEEIGRKISPEFLGLTQTAASKVVACYHDFRYQISYDYRGSKSCNFRTLEFDTVAGKWEGPHEGGRIEVTPGVFITDVYAPSYYSVWDSELDKGELGWGESKATTGSFVYTRTEFTKTDRGTKFLSQARTGALPLGKLAEVKSYKVFIHAEISSDTTLSFSHIDETGEGTPVDLTVPVAANAAVYNSGDDYVFPPPASGKKYAGRTLEVLEGPLPASRSRTPKYQIDDGGTATVAKMNLIYLLADALPLK